MTQRGQGLETTVLHFIKGSQQHVGIVPLLIEGKVLPVPSSQLPAAFVVLLTRSESILFIISQEIITQGHVATDHIR